MNDTQALIPGPNHPITIHHSPYRVKVSAGRDQIAKTDHALELKEASYPPVLYIPREDADLSQLQRTDHHTHCPYKGDASYYSIPSLGEKGENAVWTYENPHAAVVQIKEHLAFYPDRVEFDRTPL
jgi:uncharacterized protein (DUF427 family)